MSTGAPSGQQPAAPVRFRRNADRLTAGQLKTLRKAFATAYAIPDEAATRLMTASLNVTDPTAATRVVSDAVDHFGRIHVLVNNAGYGLIRAFEEMSPEQIHQQFATIAF